MAKVLNEYFGHVDASDIFAYGYGEVLDFLAPHVVRDPDWIITNPPFRLAESFALKALALTKMGVALLVRTVFIESVGRHERRESPHPGSDTLIGGNNTGTGTVTNHLYGDAFDMYGTTHGGNDKLTGGSASNNYVSNTVYGDAYYMHDTTQGGDDKLTGGSATSSGTAQNDLYGDAYEMHSSAHGGNDTLTGGNNSGSSASDHSFLYGDAFYMYDSAQGGSDTLTGGNNSNSGNVVNYLRAMRSKCTALRKGATTSSLAATTAAAALSRITSTGMRATPCMLPPRAEMTRGSAAVAVAMMSQISSTVTRTKWTTSPLAAVTR